MPNTTRGCHSNCHCIIICDCGQSKKLVLFYTKNSSQAVFIFSEVLQNPVSGKDKLKISLDAITDNSTEPIEVTFPYTTCKVNRGNIMTA